MSQIHISFSTDNAAFQSACGGDWNYEVSRILRELAALAENGQLAERNIRDINGNWVGKYAEVEE